MSGIDVPPPVVGNRPCKNTSNFLFKKRQEKNLVSLEWHFYLGKGKKRSFLEFIH